MRSILLWPWLLLLLVCGAARAETQILDKKAVEKFLNEMDQLMIRKEVDDLEKFISADAKIRITATENGETEFKPMSRSAYLADLKRILTGVTDYRQKRMETKIDIVNDGRRAIVQVKTTATLQTAERRRTGKSKLTLWVDLIDGRPQIADVRGTSSIE